MSSLFAQLERVTSSRPNAGVYLAVLAHPTDVDRQQRVLDAVGRATRNWRGCSPKKRSDIGAMNRAANIILRHRLPAAQVFAQLLPNSTGRAFGGLYESADRGPTQAAQRYLPDLRVHADINNFLSQSWVKSRPVLHYAYALLVLEPPRGFFLLLDDPSWVSGAVRKAGMIKGVIRGYPLLDAHSHVLVSAEDLISIDEQPALSPAEFEARA